MKAGHILRCEPPPCTQLSIPGWPCSQTTAGGMGRHYWKQCELIVRIRNLKICLPQEDETSVQKVHS